MSADKDIPDKETIEILDDFVGKPRDKKHRPVIETLDNIDVIDDDTEKDIFFRDCDEKCGWEIFYTAIIIPIVKGKKNKDDEWWVSGERADELIHLIRALGLDPSRYMVLDTKSGCTWFWCKNRKVRTTAALKSYIAMRIASIEKKASRPDPRPQPGQTGKPAP
jgi:hypothetical protein